MVDMSTVHVEPDCLGVIGCDYPEPHHHGFACDKTCVECHGYCHPSCPQFEGEPPMIFDELVSAEKAVKIGTLRVEIGRLEMKIRNLNAATGVAMLQLNALVREYERETE